MQIDLHNQLLTWRHKIAAKKLLPWTKRVGMQLTGRLMRSPRLFALAGWCGRQALRMLPRFVVYHRFNPWDRQRELPAPPKQSFRTMYKDRAQSSDQV